MEEHLYAFFFGSGVGAWIVIILAVIDRTLN